MVLGRVRTLPRGIPTESEVERLVNAPLPATVLGMRDRAILELFYGTGIRLGECVRLELTDLDLAEGTLFVRNGKGRKDRLVPLGGRAGVALDVYLRDARPELAIEPRDRSLFLSRQGHSLAPITIEVLVRKHARAARISKAVTPHVLRHACATHLLRGGADLRHVQELLGHRSLQTTTIYTRVEPRDLRRVLSRAHPRERTRKRGKRT